MVNSTDKYINKGALIAEIEKRLQELRPTNTHKMQTGEKGDRETRGKSGERDRSLLGSV